MIIPSSKWNRSANLTWEISMNGVIYLVGLVVVVLAILSLLGLR
jgi:hypothetical protein